MALRSAHERRNRPQMVYHVASGDRRRMKPAAFEYHRAHDLRGALELLAELGEDAKLLAGGLSLVAMMNFRRARPSALVALTRVEGLDQLRRDDEGALHIGALTTHHAVETGQD